MRSYHEHILHIYDHIVIFRTRLSTSPCVAIFETGMWDRVGVNIVDQIGGTLKYVTCLSADHNTYTVEWCFFHSQNRELTGKSISR